MKHKRILVLANNDVGLYKFRGMLLDKLISLENQVYISLPEGEMVKDLERMGCNYIETSVDRRGMNPVRDLKLYKKYSRMIEEVKPEIIITYTIKPNIYGGWAAKRKKITYVINITGLGSAFEKDNILKKCIIQMYKTACKKAKIVFFENEGNRQLFLQEKIVKEQTSCTLKGAGVDLKEYAFQEYPKDKDAIRFLYIGRLMKDKGVEELVQAFGRLQEEGYHVQLDIVGPCETDYTLSRDFYHEGIVMHGFQSDVKPYIQKCHCCVLPSYHEGMSNTLLEAAAMGRPLITSDIFGCKEAVKDNGYLVKAKEVDDLYAKMKMFAEMPYEKRKKLGENSCRHMEDNFSKERVVEETIRKIEE